LATDKHLNPLDVIQLREQFEQRHTGYKNAHRLAILHSGLKYQRMAFTPRDMENMDFRKYTRDELIQILGMKKSIISVTEGLNRATAEMQLKDWWESTNIPVILGLETGINVQLLKGDPGIKVMWDLSTVKALQADFKELSEIAKIYWSMGLPFDTINERLNLGYGKVPGGDVGYLPLSLMPVDSSMRLLPGGGEIEGMGNLLLPGEKAKRIEVGEGMWEVRSALRWEIFNRRLVRTEQSFEGKLKKIFFEMRRNVLSILHDGEPAKRYPLHMANSGTVLQRGLKENLAAINTYNYKLERELLEKAASGFYERSVTDGAETLIDEMDFDMAFDISDPLVIGYLGAKKTKITGVVNTIKKQIDGEIRKGIAEGEDTMQIEKRLKKIFGKANNRAKVVARTEVGGAMNFGRYFQINQSGFKYKIWYTAYDERVRGADEDVPFSHALMHKAKLLIGPNSVWDVNGEALEYPGDYQGSPANIIQCRCFEIIDTSEA